MTDKKCPNCGLWNTGSALRCDCGYDFGTATLEKPVSTGIETSQDTSSIFARRMPKDSKEYARLMTLANPAIAIFYLVRQPITEIFVGIGVLIVWLLLVYWSYRPFLQKKTWAIILFMLLNLPISLGLLMYDDFSSFRSRSKDD